MNTNRNILIINDDPLSQKKFSKTLKSKGYVPFVVSNREAVLDRLKTEIPVVAVIDLALQDGQGLALMSEIMAYSSNIECLVLAHNDIQDLITEAINLGACNYLNKPYNLDQLVAIIGRAIEKHEAEAALQQYIERMNVMHLIDRDILAAQSPTDIVQAALGHMWQLVPCQRVSMTLFDFESNQGLMFAVRVDDDTFVDVGRQVSLAEFRSIETLQQGQYYVADDIETLTDLTVLERQRLTKEGIRSFVNLPLLSRGELLGSLNLAATSPSPWQAQHIEIANQVAARLAIAIQQSRLFDETQRRVWELTELHEITQHFSLIADAREAYEALTARLAHLVGSQKCVFMLLDEVNGQMYAQIPGYGISDELLTTCIYSVRDAAKIWNFKKQGPFIANSKAEIPIFFHKLIELSGVESALAVPMWIEDRLVGQVVVSNKADGFTADDARLLGVFANHAGTVIQNVRLFGAVQENEERFRALVDASFEGLAISIKGKIVEANRTFANILGYDLPEVMGMPLTTMIAPESIELVLKNAELDKTTPYEIMVLRKDTTTFYAEIMGKNTIHRGQKARVTGVRDITRRKQQEAALQTSEEKYFTILNEINEGYYEVNLAANLTFFNYALPSLFGYPGDELMGMDNRQLSVDEPTAKRVYQAFNKVYKTGKPLKRFEWNIMSKNGQIKTLETSASLRKDANGEPIGFRGIIRDITKRKQAEKVRKAHAERLEEMVAERTQKLQDAQGQLIRQKQLTILGQLAGGVGHELRNPLGVISNAVYFLKMVLSEADETIKEYLEMISARVKEAEKIVSDLLNLSRNRAIAKEEVVVMELVAETFGRHPPPPEISVITNSLSELPPVFVDPQHIRQVLTNLVINAYQAMPQGGELTLEAKVIAEKVHLSVSDTGQGMSPEILSNIFEPLFTTKTKGIGLGLVVSRNLVEINGGSIEVESVEGQGTTFITTLLVNERVDSE